MVLADYVHEITHSGFPAIRPLSGRPLRAQLDGYLNRIIDKDFQEQGHSVRKPQFLMCVENWSRLSLMKKGEPVWGVSSEMEIMISGNKFRLGYFSMKSGRLHEVLHWVDICGLIKNILTEDKEITWFAGK